MYVYLTGGGTGGMILDDNDVIGVFDVDNASHSKLTREFLQARQDLGELITLADGLPRYMTVTSDGKTYLTHFAAKSIAPIAAQASADA
jgi:hypothetical protein